jgi:DNA (cytosine-5)-methyltransferase 1
MKKDSMHFIDLFSGAGGFSLGFTRAGFKCAGAVEKDSCAGRTYIKNFPQHEGSPFSRLGPETGDILTIDQKLIDRAYVSSGLKEIDVLLAGPPCQGFSLVGRAKLDFLADRTGAFLTDSRNDLYVRFLEILAWIRPRAFLFENVIGMLHLGGSNLAEMICRNVSEMGYNVAWTILNAAWYGVPQTRERVFILGLRRDLGVQPSFPRPVHRTELTNGHRTRSISRSSRNLSFFTPTLNPDLGPPAIDVEVALCDLPPFLGHLSNPSYRAVRASAKQSSYRPGRPGAYASLMRKWDDFFVSDSVTDHFSRHTPRDYPIFGRMRPGDKYPQAVRIAKDLYNKSRKLYSQGKLRTPPRRKHYVPPYRLDGFEEKWRKLDPLLPSWTITAHLEKDCYSHIHYDDSQMRTITVREAARLQTFPDAFVFSGSMGDCFRQIGNAVPPLLAFALADHLRFLLADTDKTPLQSSEEHTKTEGRK